MVCDSSQHIVGTSLDYPANDLEREQWRSMQPWPQAKPKASEPEDMVTQDHVVHSYPSFSG